MKQGHIFIIAGPSGVGKNSIIKYLSKNDTRFKKIPSYTTRPSRPDDGDSRIYLSEPEFQKLIDNDELIEWARTHGYLYGKSKKNVTNLLKEGYLLLLEIDVKGLKPYRELFPNLTAIFLQYPSLEDLKERLLLARENISNKEINTRFETAKQEMTYANLYDYTITTHTGDNSSIPGKKVEKIINTILNNKPIN